MRFLAARLVQFGFQATADYLLSECAAADEEADKKEETATSSAEPCPTCPDPKKDDDDDDGDEQAAKDAKRMSDKKLDQAAKNNGYKDAHDLKKQLGYDRKTDIFVDKNGEMYAGPTRGRTGLPERLWMNVKGK